MNSKNILKNDTSKIHTKEIKLCESCFMNSNKIIPCAKCRIKLCKCCVTYINDVPFCNDCIVDIVRNKTKLMIISGELDDD